MTQGPSGYVPGQGGYANYFGNGANDNYFPGATANPAFGAAPTAPQGNSIGSVGQNVTPVNLPGNANTPVAGNLGQYYTAPGTSAQPSGNAGGGVGGAMNFNPASTGGQGTLGNNTGPVGNPGAGYVSVPTYGQFGQSLTPGMIQQQMQERYSVTKAPSYGDYEVLGTNAQNAALYGQNALNNPQAAAALAAQQNQAGSQSTQQLSAQSYQNSALANLQAAAQGNGPTAADIQGQRSIDQAMRAQLTAGASARGGAYQQAAAQQQAGVNAANVQAQGAASAAQLRAQEMQAAQGQYAQAAGTAVQGANTGYAAQQQALAASTGAAQAEQGLGLNYYNQLAGLYNQQSGQAAQLASNQVANDYGLAGTSLTTQTQQNIANQQQNAQYTQAGVGALTGLLAVAAAASTGGAESAATGARIGGAPPEEAAGIGRDVGQRLGELRMGPAAVRFAPADAEAARKGAGFPTANALPGPATEPAAHAAFNAGLEAAHLRHALEHLAKLRGGRRAGR